MKEFIIILMIVIPWILLWFLSRNSNNIIVKTIEICFRQGNHVQRRKLLKTIVEAIDKEYNEDNWYTSTYWLVEEILRVDDNFTDKIDTDCLKAGLRDVVDEVLAEKYQVG